MWRLLFLSSISALVAPGCSDDCGPGDAPEYGLLASSADVTLNYGAMTSSPNNDCRDSTVPDIISLTLEGREKDSGSLIVLCIPRPDQLAKMDMQIGTGLQIVDVNGDKDGCTYKFDSTRLATGTVHAVGLCDNGTNDAGYALGIEGNISLLRNCAGTMESIAVELSGQIAIKKKPL